MSNGPKTKGQMSTPDAQSPSERSTIAGLTFDRALEELQATVAQLETGGQPLEEAIVLYERGVALHEHCARLLADAELRVQRLVERAGGALEAMAVVPGDAEGGS
jgi:exodeoxyribonuclease VII small subunit